MTHASVKAPCVCLVDNVVELPGRPYPLDRYDELARTGYDLDQLLRESKQAGWVVNRRMMRAWIQSGMLPPPTKKGAG